MIKTIAADPGKISGVAVFEGNTLIDVTCVKGEAIDQAKKLYTFVEKFTELDTCLIELPQIYERTRWKGSPNDLIKVGVIAGTIAAVFSNCRKIKFIKPAEWKGSRPKNIDNIFTRNLLTKAEQARLEKIPTGRINHVLDAVGLGLWHLKRR